MPINNSQFTFLRFLAGIASPHYALTADTVYYIRNEDAAQFLAMRQSNGQPVCVVETNQLRIDAATALDIYN